MTRSAIRATVSRLIEKRLSDDELARLDEQSRRARPAVIARGVPQRRSMTGRSASSPIPIKGFGLPFAGHKDNHAGLMTPAQMEVFRKAMAVRPGHEWDKFEGLPLPPARLQKFLDDVPFAAPARAA
jgi:pyruvate dehydrogenase E1 component